MELRYDPAWVGADLGRPLSLSLPFNLQNLPVKGEKVAHYFDNLLPDSDAIRRRVAERFRMDSTAPFDLLKAIGRDCVGAVQILDEDEVPTGFERIEGVPLSEEDIERHLLEIVSPPRFAAGRDPGANFRISLAGALRERSAMPRPQSRSSRKSSPGPRLPSPKCRPNCHPTSHRAFSTPSSVGLSRRPEPSAGCGREPPLCRSAGRGSSLEVDRD